MEIGGEASAANLDVEAARGTGRGIEKLLESTGIEKEVIERAGKCGLHESTAAVEESAVVIMESMLIVIGGHHHQPDLGLRMTWMHGWIATLQIATSPMRQMLRHRERRFLSDHHRGQTRVLGRKGLMPMQQQDSRVRGVPALLSRSLCSSHQQHLHLHPLPHPRMHLHLHQ